MGSRAQLNTVSNICVSIPHPPSPLLPRVSIVPRDLYGAALPLHADCCLQRDQAQRWSAQCPYSALCQRRGVSHGRQRARPIPLTPRRKSSADGRARTAHFGKVQAEHSGALEPPLMFPHLADYCFFSQLRVFNFHPIFETQLSFPLTLPLFPGCPLL